MTLPILAALAACQPLYMQIERHEAPEPRTKQACVDGTCRDMTRAEFDTWIRDQQRRGAL